MPCHATPRHAMLCHAMPCHAMSCHARATPRYAMVKSGMPWYSTLRCPRGTYHRCCQPDQVSPLLLSQKVWMAWRRQPAVHKQVRRSARKGRSLPGVACGMWNACSQPAVPEGTRPALFSLPPPLHAHSCWHAPVSGNVTRCQHMPVP
eukprot:364721-Chlamydomonas_euryale.AAC.18